LASSTKTTKTPSCSIWEFLCFKYVTTIVVTILLSGSLVAEVTPFSVQFSHANGSDERHQPLRPSRRQGPAVVLLHGFGFTGDMWAPMAIVLARDHTVIVPDLRGMGMSDHPDTGYNKKNQAVDIAGIMDALKVQKADLVHT